MVIGICFSIMFLVNIISPGFAMVTETRWFGVYTHTVNGVTAYEMTTVEPTDKALQTFRLPVPGNLAIAWGIRVWRVDGNEKQIEITNGLPVAIVERPVLPTPPYKWYGLQSNAWTCPETKLFKQSAILFKVYMKYETYEWVLLESFMTERLGARLLSGTWTIKYWTYREYDPLEDKTRGGFGWGSVGTDPWIFLSCIEEFQWWKFPLTRSVLADKGFIGLFKSK